MKISLFVPCRATVLAVAFSFSSFVFGGTPEDSAKTPVVDLGNQIWTQPLLGTGIKTSDVYTDGHLFITAPVWSTIGKDGTLGGDYLFLEPYSSLGDQGELATSLGLSWRHLFNNQSTSKLKDAYTAGFLDEGWYIGGNLFVDMLRTHADNEFWQAGFGLEVGSRYVELRGNYYLPFDGSAKLASRTETDQTFTSQSRSSSTSLGAINQQQTIYGDPLATGNSIQQQVSASNTLTNTATTTTYTTTTHTTVKTITSLYEEGMEGWDAELAVLVPWVDQWMDVKLLGGYYRFNNQPFGPQSLGTGDVHGWKGGVEIRPVPALVIDGLWYEDKKLTGSNWVVGVSLEIPMDKTWKDAFKTRRRHLVERLAEPVHRMNDAIKVGNSEDQSTSVSSTSSTSAKSQTIVLNSTSTHSTQTVTIKDDIIFVNNGGPVGNGIQAGSLTGTGTAEKPVNTVQTGSTLAGTNSNTQPGHIWTAYIQGGANPTYTENVNVIGSTSFVGSGTGGGFAALGGKSFGGSGAQPHIAGGFANANILPVSFIEYRGLQITGGNSANSNHAIDAQNVTTLLVTNNTISSIAGSGAGVHVLTDDGQLVPGTAVISGNSFSSIGGNAVDIYTLSSSVLTAMVSGNDFHSAGGDSIHTESYNTSMLTTTSSGNSLHGTTGEGISAQSFDSSTTTYTAAGDSIASQGGNGIHFVSNDTSTFTGTVTGSTITQPALNGILAEVKNNAVSPGMTLTVQGNSISGTTSNAVLAQNLTSVGSLNVPILSGNIITVTSGTGLLVQNATGVDGTVTVGAINGNHISGTTANGVLVQNTALVGIVNLTSVSGNTITTAGGSGVLVQNSASSGGTVGGGFSIDSNIISGTTANGVLVQNTGGGLASVDLASVNGNTITTAGGSGVTVQNSAAVSGTVGGSGFTVDNNHISGTTANGVLVQNTALIGIVNLTSVNGNTITTAGGGGVLVQNSASSGGTVGGSGFSVDGNIISGTTANGVLVQNTGPGLGSVGLSSVDNNTITTAGGSGVTVQNNAPTVDGTVGGGSGFTVDSNHISGTTLNGVLVQNTTTAGIVNLSSVNGNTIMTAGGSGVLVQNSTPSGGTVGGSGFSIDSNIISGTTANGVAVQNTTGSGSLGLTGVNGNTITTAGGGGVLVQNSASLGGAVGGSGFSIDSNIISGTTTNGVFVQNASVAGNVGLTGVNGNTITTAGGTGVLVQNSTSSGGTVGGSGFSIDNNLISGTTVNGVLVENNGPFGTMKLTSVNGNTITTAGGSGVLVQDIAAGGGTIGSSGFTIDNNHISGTTVDGVFVQNTSFNGAVNLTGVDNNSITTAAGIGLSLADSNVSSMTSTVTGNTISYLGTSGVQFTASNTATVNVTNFDGNQITLTGAATGDHIHLDGTGGTLTINGTLTNTITPVPNTLGDNTVNNVGTTATGTIIINSSSVNVFTTPNVP